MNSHAPVCSPSNQTQVRLSTPARLHLGFLDLNAGLGRKFGSIGLAVDSHYTRLHVSRADEDSISGLPAADTLRQRLAAIKQQFFQRIGQSIAPQQQAVAIHIEQLIPEHAGLGSGTQLTLALSQALARLYDIDCQPQQLAAAMERGRRSGIGISTFEHGGFVIDAGINQRSNSLPLPLLHLQFPDHWRIVMIMDSQAQGVHGQPELQAFQDLPAFPRHAAETICHRTLMQLLPSLLEQDIQSFGAAVSAIQRLIGDHFAPAQGGRYASDKVARLLEYAHANGHSGIAQSSWGPTGCVFTADQASAETLLTELNDFATQEFADCNGLSLLIATADQRGAIIERSASHGRAD